MELQIPKNAVKWSYVLQIYIKTYLREEVLQEGLTRNMGAFSRFLEIASFSQGSILNISEVSRESGIERKVWDLMVLCSKEAALQLLEAALKSAVEQQFT